MRKVRIAIAVGVVIVSAGIGAAQEPAAQTAASTSTGNTKKQLRTPDPDKWWFEVAPYLWTAAIKTEAEIGDVEAETDMDFGDLLDVLDAAIMLHAEAHHGDWGIFADVMYSKLSDDENIGPQNGGEIDVEIEQTFVELGGMYRFGGDKASFDALFGARGIFTSTDIDITGANGGDADFDENQVFVGPLVGGRFMYNFTPRWFTSLRIDGSGFGIDDHWTANGTALFGYRFTNLFTLAFGYRYMIIDFEDGDLDVTQTMQGPVLGFGFRFGG